MKKLGIILVGFLFVMPTASHAATTTDNTALIQTLMQMVIKLQAQIQQILAQKNETPSVTPSITDPTVTVESLVESPAVIQNGKVTFDIKFSVTTGSTTIDIPQDSTGVIFQISKMKDGYTSSFALTCSNSSEKYCEVPPQTTSRFELKVMAPSSQISGGTPQLTVNQIKYVTDVNTDNQKTYYAHPLGSMQTVGYVVSVK